MMLEGEGFEMTVLRHMTGQITVCVCRQRDGAICTVDVVNVILRLDNCLPKATIYCLLNWPHPLDKFLGMGLGI